jgi:hypothetical protein
VIARRAAATVAGIGLALALAVPASAATNLLHDGSFEKPVVPSGSFAVFSNGQTFFGWTVVGASGNVGVISGTFTQNGFTFPAKSGHQWLDLTGTSNSATGIAQKVSTTPSHNYTLTFAVGNVYDPNGIFGVTSTVNVLVNGVHVATVKNSRGKGSTSMVWQTFHVTVAATSTTTTIALINGDPANDTLNGLDAVTLT